jgi:UDP-N-acetylmuramoyl-tripeptide--D-alanyl-D-alanine ligase
MGDQASNLLAGASEAGMDSDHLTQAADHAEIAGTLQSLMGDGDWVLVKGSRGMRMEKVIEILIADIEAE